MTPLPNVIDVTESTFAEAVLEKSRNVPVIVDFWAPWCGPCRTIGPVLEKLAGEHEGAILVARVNVDENQNLARSFNISGIPHVMGFHNGEIATEFTGAVPESTIREFVARLLPTEAETTAAAGRKKLAAGRTEEAEELFRTVLIDDPLNGVALLGLAEIEAARGRSAEALVLLDQVPPGTERGAADRLAARLRIQSTASVDEDALRARIRSNPADLEALLQLARSAAASGRHEEALGNYLAIVRHDRSYQDDAGRRGMIDLFQLLGRDHPLTERFRGELSNLLFS